VAWGYALRSGKAHVRAKLRAYRWLLKHKDEIRKKHKDTQWYRGSSDAELLGITSVNLSMEQLAGEGLGRIAGALLNPAFRLWRCVLQSAVH
jgi:hypothetical protein